jgi:hypothetical protein
MPLFEIENQSLHSIEQSCFDKEKRLRTLVERNLQVVINFRLVASEFPTGV